MSKIVSREEIGPATVDFRLPVANEFSRAWNTRRALKQLASLHPIIKTIKPPHDNEYRRLAWCNTFSRAWITAFSRNAVLGSGEKEVNPDIKCGLLQCLKASSKFFIG